MPEAAALEKGLRVRELGVELSGVPIVRDVAFEVPAGSITALAGPNGAGKTTALRALVGLVEHRGTITLDGRNLDQLERRERARALGYVPQRSLLNASLCVRDVAFQGRFCHMREFGRPSRSDREAVERALESADVSGIADRSFIELSGGEQRRVLLARALATEAPVLVLDEPTASLDVRHVLTLFRTLRKLADAGHVVLVVLHDLRDTQTLADRVLLMKAGALVAQGAVSSCLTPERVLSVYGVRIGEERSLGFSLPEDET
jgi:iron complex transport system ATP-binding protein